MPYMKMVAGAMIVIVGIHLFIAAIKRLMGKSDHHHHDHDHGHSHGDHKHGHTHCHNGPVVISIQGTSLYSGCHGVLDHICLKFFKSSNEIS